MGSNHLHDTGSTSNAFKIFVVTVLEFTLTNLVVSTMNLLNIFPMHISCDAPLASIKPNARQKN